MHHAQDVALYVSRLRREREGFERLLQAHARPIEPSTLVRDVLAAPAPAPPADLRDVFTYRVPVTTDDGACAASKEIAPEPFDLGRELFGAAEWLERARDSLVTQTLLRFRVIVEQLAKRTGVDWLGIYRLREGPGGERYLVKLAYVGRLSRAVFPLNELFHEISNNSWVAMEASARLIQNVATYTGPYYACDGEVQSELCAPIFDAAGERVLGIIDAESFQAQHFDAQRVADVFAACAQLSDALASV